MSNIKKHSILFSSWVYLFDTHFIQTTISDAERRFLDANKNLDKKNALSLKIGNKNQEFSQEINFE